MKKNSKIFIAFHMGILGRALISRMKMQGFTDLLVSSNPFRDFSDPDSARSFFLKKKPDYCFVPAIREGGIGINISSPGELIYQNLISQINIIDSAWQAKVKKLIFLGSSCVYPKDCPQPMKEGYLFTGALEPTSEAYATAKISGIKMCQAYNKQYGTDFISVVPATIFGPNDNFDPVASHVIPALINKFHYAKIKKIPAVAIWGSGRPYRDFIYADDLADACIFIMRHNNAPDIINVGMGSAITIRDLAQQIRQAVGFKGKITFDRTKADGVFKKFLDTGRINSLGWRPKMTLAEGIRDTYRWYRQELKENGC